MNLTALIILFDTLSVEITHPGIFCRVRANLLMVVCLILASTALKAEAPVDTISVAKQLRDNGKVKKAETLLKIFHAHHPDDLNATWLYAQTAYWAKHLKKSKKLYEQAIQTNAGNYYLKLDYAKMLVDVGEYIKAKPMLVAYLAYDPSNTQAQLALAKISYGRGDFKAAENGARKVLQEDAGDKKAADLLKEIAVAESPWLKIKAAYYTDDQPMQSILPVVEAGVFIHPSATLRFGLQAPVFFANGKTYNSQWFQVGDQSLFRKIGFEIDVDAGVVKQVFANRITWTGNIELHQTFLKHLVLSAQVQRKPYTLTNASLDTALMVNRYAASVEWNDMNSWNGKASFELSQFPDQNYTLAASAWLFAPPLKVSVFEFRLGYGYGYSTAKESRWNAKESVSQIVANFETAPTIAGVYSPYFTPNDMQIHSALGSITIHAVKAVDIGVNGSVGFYATDQNPYLYLNINEPGDTVVARGFSKTSFLPGNIGAYLLVRFSNTVSLKAEYNYTTTYFYSNHHAGLGLKMNFLNGKKERK